MAAVSLNSNLAALRAKRALNASSAELASNLERLSSGKRINQASDDAAGLAVSSTLNATARVHTQAARNVNDGISFLNVADGATSALKDILFRIRELSTQSSNGTFSNAQRQSIDKESQALQAEYGRILDTTSFNGIRVFGSADVVVQAGFGTDAALLVKLASTETVTVKNGDGTFQGYQSFVTGSGPVTVGVADFNGDGKSDLVTADNGNARVSVLLGNGNGTFQAKQDFLTGSQPSSVAVGDFNGDGKNDLATADYGNSTMSILLGNGNGTFQAKNAYVSGVGIGLLVVGDFDGDGKNDLASAEGQDATVSVFLGNGNGTFRARKAFAAYNDGGYSVAVADVNGDGKSDIVAVDYTAKQVSILLGNGNGTLHVEQTFDTNRYPTSVAVEDFNADGKSDLVTTDDNDNTASVLLGNGNGTFQAKHSLGTGGGPVSVAVSDFNSDGKIDLVTANHDDGTVSMLLGNGNGTFQAMRTLSTQAGTSDVVIADLNGDGVKDLVTANNTSNRTNVLLGNGTTTTTTVTGYGLQPITGVSLATQPDALSAQGQIDDYLNSVNKVSRAIGTALSRFQIAAHVASSVADVSQAAEARITDADVADNSARLVRNQILQQAASAVLAQANQQPALALTLLND